MDFGLQDSDIVWSRRWLPMLRRNHLQDNDPLKSQICFDIVICQRETDSRHRPVGLDPKFCLHHNYSTLIVVSWIRPEGFSQLMAVSENIGTTDTTGDRTRRVVCSGHSEIPENWTWCTWHQGVSSDPSVTSVASHGNHGHTQTVRITRGKGSCGWLHCRPDLTFLLCNRFFLMLQRADTV